MRKKYAQILSVLLSTCILMTSTVYAEDVLSVPLSDEDFYQEEVDEGADLEDADEDLSVDEGDDDILVEDENDVLIEDGETLELETEVEIDTPEEEESESLSEEESELDDKEGTQNLAGVLQGNTMVVSLNGAKEADIPVSDSVKTICSFYNGSNLEAQDYHTWASPIKSYLTESPDGGLMRVQANAIDSGTLLIEYYDKEYNIQQIMTLKLALPIFGGFFEDENDYYILTGQNNTDRDNSKEVYRLTKYSKDWKAQGDCSIFGFNTYAPFAGGSARMTKYGKYIFVRSCHQMYNGHQANVTFSVDTSSMTEIEDYGGVSVAKKGYVSHSFNQFIQVDNGTLIGSDHGDAYPRAIVVLKYPTDISEGKFVPSYSNECDVYQMLKLPGLTGENYTGVSQGGFEFSDSSYLIAGNEDTNGEYSSRNVFVASIPKEGGTTTMHYFSDYAGSNESATTPHLIKTGKNSFVLLWSSKTNVYYTAIDGHGAQVGTTYKMTGNLSDCAPAVVGGKLIWYAWKNEHVTFYEISLSDLSVNRAVRIENGHHYEAGTEVTDGQIHVVCKVCGDSVPYAVPTSIEYDTYALNRYYASVKDKLYLVSGQTYQITWKNGFQNTELDRMMDSVITSSDPSILDVEKTSTDSADIKPLKAGKATVTVQDKYNPEAACKVEIYVDTIDTEMVSFGARYFDYDGTEHDVLVNVSSALDVLTNGTDYEVIYEGDRVNAGTASVTVTGKGKFTGSVTEEVVIKPVNIYSYGMSVVFSPETSIYNGQPQMPEAVAKYRGTLLSEGKDYKISYSNNTNAGEATAVLTGIGNYTGEYKRYFTIDKAHVSDCKVSLSETSVDYDGTEKEPEVVLKNGNTVLQKDVDYEVYYSSNVLPGTAWVTVTGIGNYDGNLRTSFTITGKLPEQPSNNNTVQPPLKENDPLDWIWSTFLPDEKCESGNESAQKSDGQNATENGNAIAFTVKSKAKGKVTVSWKKVKNVTSYQVQYSMYKNMKKAKTVTVKKSAKSTVIKKLKRKKNCYIRMRTVKKSGKKKTYSKWSNIKSVKVK